MLVASSRHPTRVRDGLGVREFCVRVGLFVKETFALHHACVSGQWDECQKCHQI